MSDAAISIMSNIAEGYERCGPAEFHRFLLIAKGSCAEVRSQLYVALDAGHITKDVFQGLMHKAEEVGRLIGGLRLSVEKKRESR
jgi:four helix bundle protein